MTEKERYEALKKYMKIEFGVTPENIDDKLGELKIEFKKKLDIYERKNQLENPIEKII